MKKAKKVIAGVVTAISLFTISSTLSVSASEEELVPYDTTTLNNIGTYINVGDVNLDGKINVADIVILNQYVSGSISINEIQRRQADVDGNGIAEKSDSDMIQNYILHIIEDFPCKSYIIGDVNLDGNIDMDDVDKMLLYIMNKESFSITEHRAADINNDGAVDMNDLSALTTYLS